jgi:hypothetical protein
MTAPLPDAVPLTALQREELETAYTTGVVWGALKQERFAAHLKALGPPGMAAWDPIAGEVTLRGHTFRAEQLGSFDGATWLWSWANALLGIPEARTTYARRLRDEVGHAVGLLRAPHVALADERLPHMLAALALAHTDAEGYYIANAAQVYVMLPGEVRAPRAKALDELRGALTAIDGVPAMPRDLAAGLPVAARALGLAVVDDGARLIVRDGDDEVVLDRSRAHLTRLAVAFLPGRRTLDDVLALISGDVRVPRLVRAGDVATASGDGWEVSLRVEDRLRTVMREANALPRKVDAARGCGTVAIVETASRWGLEGVAPWQGAWLATSNFEDPVGVVAPQALAVCERLHAVAKDALIYDVYLRRFYGE